MTELVLTGHPAAARAAAWLLTYLAHSTLLLAAAWLLGRVLRSPAVRDVLWKAATLGAVATASAATVLAARAAPLPEPRLLVAEAGETREVESAAAPLRVPAGAVVGLWLGAALLGVVRLERSRRRYWRHVGRRGTLPDPGSVAALRRLQDAAGFPRTVFLTTSEGIGAPAAVGTAEICLPADSFAALSPAQRESVLAHELAHLVRRDPLWRLATELLAALFTVQPLLRVARREMRECAEMLADDFAVRVTGRRRPLVESLAILAASLRPDHAAAAAFGEGDSPLVQRAARVLDAGRAPSGPLPRPLAAALAAGLLLATAGLAPAVPPPPAAPRAETRLFDAERLVGDSAGSVLRFTERAEGLRREVIVRPGPGGEPRYEYRENGAAREPDESDRRWIDDMLRGRGLR